MSKAKVQRSEDYNRAVVNDLVITEVQDMIEEHKFAALVRRGILVEAEDGQRLEA